MNVAVVAPTATTTLAGTVAAAVVSLARVTVLCAAVPTAGALRVTVAIELDEPPTTLAGFRLNEATPGWGNTVSGALWPPPFRVAEIFAVLVVDTA